MTLENIAVWSLRKGTNLLGTGDCLQGAWLEELEASLVEAEPGFFQLRPELAARVEEKLSANLRHPLRFVLSTEVCCAPPPRKEIEGLHHLIYFPSFDHVHRLREGLAPHGDLTAGRPTVNLNSLTLFERVLDLGPDCHLAPAHVFNPWFSALGTIGGDYSLDEIFGDLTGQLIAVETGLTSTPPMCRRVSSLDRFGLFSCSDAHSLENLGREYTVVDIEPSYRALFDALSRGAEPGIVRTVKYPLHRTRYFLNWCSHCQKPFDAQLCTVCRRTLVEGSRGRLEKVADRSTPVIPADAPPHQELLPLAEVIGEALRRKPDTEAVRRLQQTLLEKVGHERFVLTAAPEDQIAEIVTPPLARAIVAQRTAPAEFFAQRKAAPAPKPIVEQKLLPLSS